MRFWRGTGPRGSRREGFSVLPPKGPRAFRIGRVAGAIRARLRNVRCPGEVMPGSAHFGWCSRIERLCKLPRLRVAVIGEKRRRRDFS